MAKNMDHEKQCQETLIELLQHEIKEFRKELCLEKNRNAEQSRQLEELRNNRDTLQHVQHGMCLCCML